MIQNIFPTDLGMSIEMSEAGRLRQHCLLPWSGTHDRWSPRAYLLKGAIEESIQYILSYAFPHNVAESPNLQRRLHDPTGLAGHASARNISKPRGHSAIPSCWIHLYRGQPGDADQRLSQWRHPV